MRWILYIAIAAAIYVVLANGFELFVSSGRTGQYLGGTLSAVAALFMLGGLIAIPGLIGLFLNKNWGVKIASLGLGLAFLGGILTITVGTVPVPQILAPLISLILLFVIKK